MTLLRRWRLDDALVREGQRPTADAGVGAMGRVGVPPAVSGVPPETRERRPSVDSTIAGMRRAARDAQPGGRDAHPTHRYLPPTCKPDVRQIVGHPARPNNTRQTFALS